MAEYQFGPWPRHALEGWCHHLWQDREARSHHVYHPLRPLARSEFIRAHGAAIDSIIAGIGSDGRYIQVADTAAIIFDAETKNRVGLRKRFHDQHPELSELLDSGGAEAIYNHAGLTDRERQVIELETFQITEVQIAQTMQVALGTVHSFRHRAHKKLRQLLALYADARNRNGADE